MFGNTMELMQKLSDEKAENRCLRDKIARLEVDLRDESDIRKRQNALSIEEAKNEIRKEMQKRLIESDLLRTEAVAKLDTYEKMDTKDDRKHMRSMLDKAITSLGQKPMIVK